MFMMTTESGSSSCSDGQSTATAAAKMLRSAVVDDGVPGRRECSRRYRCRDLRAVGHAILTAWVVSALASSWFAMLTSASKLTPGGYTTVDFCRAAGFTLTLYLL
jgi:hypothetical protein